jgi:hypothetical protein
VGEANGHLGSNINGQGISADLITPYTAQSHSRTQLVINESKLAALIQTHTPRVIYRMKGDAGIVNDDHAHEHHDPREFARVQNILAPPGCWVYGGNEPGSATLDKLNNWTLAYVEECVKFSRKPVVFNNFVFHPTQGAAGWRIIEPSALAALQAGGAIGVHIYFDTRVSASASAFRVIDDVHEVHGDVPIVVTEYGCAVGYDAFRGYKGTLDEDQYANELIAGVEAHGGQNIDWLVYIDGLWAEGRSYEILHAYRLKQRLAEYNRMTQANYGTRIERGLVILKGTSTLNVRPIPGTSQAAIGQLKGGELLPYWSQPVNGWLQIEYTGRVAYISDQYADITAAPIDPTPPLPIPPLEWDPDNRVSRQQLAAFHRALANVIEFGVTSP